jgi:hypothetical protein
MFPLHHGTYSPHFFLAQKAASIDMNFQSDIMASFENTIG